MAFYELNLVNGKTPGDTIWLDEGDEVSVTVNNFMPYNTSQHWHGFLQNGTLWSDGVPGTTQRSIGPNESFVANFSVAGQYGAYWAHSHFKSVYEDGQRQAVYIRPSPSRPRPFSLLTDDSTQLELMMAAENNTQVIGFNDWSRHTSQERLALYEKTGVEPLCYDSMLINGLGRQICPSAEVIAQAEAFPPGFRPNLTDKGCISPYSSAFFVHLPWQINEVDQSTWSGCTNTTTSQAVFEVPLTDGYASLAFVSMSSGWATSVSVDSHNLTLYAADGDYIEPITTQAATLVIGSRYSALVNLTEPGDYTVRFAAASLVQIMSGFAVLRVVADPSALSKTPVTTTADLSVIGPGAWLDYSGNPLNNASILGPTAPSITPWPVNAPPAQADVTFLWNMYRNVSNVWLLANDQTFDVPDQSVATPILFAPNSTLAHNATVHVPLGGVVDVILQADINGQPHPIHKHSGKMWLLGSAEGQWTWSSVAAARAALPAGTLNLQNPPFLDVVNTLGPDSWLLARFVADQSGPVLIHCHILSHESTGMAIVISQGLDSWPQVPSGYALDVQPSPLL